VITKLTIPYGSNMQGLVDFLFGPGKSEEHTDPHIIAAYADIFVGDRADTSLARTMLAIGLDNPRTTMLSEVREKFVLHITVTAAPEDGLLGEDTWAHIARAIAAHLGFDDEGHGAPLRWIAVYHGVTNNGHDHMHVVANRVGEDGRTHAFARPPTVMLSQIRRDMEILHRLRLVGHRGDPRTAL